MEFDEKTYDFKCSDVFKRIMTELGPKKTKKGDKRMSTSTVVSKNNDALAEADESEEDEDDEDDEFLDGETEDERRRRRRAQRAWSLVRRHIQELRVERRMAVGGINWDFLRQTISAMSDMEKARHELYERYIYKPNWWADGLTRCPDNLVRKYRNRGPLLPPVSESNHARDTKDSRQSGPNTSLRNSSGNGQGNRKRSGVQSTVRAS